MINHFINFFLIKKIEKSFYLNFRITYKIIANLSIFENNENLYSQILIFSNWNFVENSIFNIRLNELSLIPEFFLAFTAVIIITHCSLIAYSKKYSSALLQFSITSLVMLILFLTFLLFLQEEFIIAKQLSFEFSFLNDSLGFLSKIITILASLFCVYLLQDYIIEYKINNTEYDLLMLYAILGLTMLITANDFGTIFLALELQSLSLYMLAGFKKNSIYSIESGLKYFILGALSAAYFLLGWSLLYGISGLFVLVGFHFFFFNIFSDVNTKLGKSVTEYKIDDENKLENNGFEETFLTLTPWTNLSTSTSNFGEMSTSLLEFHFELVLKIIKLFGCEHCNSTEDEILKLYDSKKTKIKYDEVQTIECDFCRSFVESFKSIVDNKKSYYNKDELRREIDKHLSKSNKFLLMNNQKKKCWFCYTVIKHYKESIEKEKCKARIRTKKMMNIYEFGLVPGIFLYYYKYLLDYFTNRNLLLSSEVEKDLLIEAIFKAATDAEDLEKNNIPVCEHIIKRFNKAWVIEGFRYSVLLNKIRKACKKLENEDKLDEEEVCKTIKNILMHTVKNKNSVSKKETEQAECSNLKKKKYSTFYNEVDEELENYSWNQFYKQIKHYSDRLISLNTCNKVTDFNKIEKKNLSVLDNNLFIHNKNDYTIYSKSPLFNTTIYSENKNTAKIKESDQIKKKIDFNNKKKEVETKMKKVAQIQFKKSTSKTNEFKLAESSLTLILISFFFKLAVAPFHLWSLDIYEGSLTSSTIFFAVVTKFSVIVILIKICYYGFYSLLKSSLYQSIIIVSASSILVGSIAGLTERKLKSLLAYSSINNIGYILLALTIGTLNGIKTTIFYLIIYISSSLATWSGLISIQLQKNRYMKKQNKEFGDVIMLRKTNPILALTLQIALFSTAGLPPFIGFLTKMDVFITSIESHIFLISLVTILLSIISTFYYLRLVKIMCFEKALVGKLYKPVKIKQSNVNSIFSFLLLYQFFKPWISIFFSYKVVIC